MNHYSLYLSTVNCCCKQLTRAYSNKIASFFFQFHAIELMYWISKLISESIEIYELHIKTIICGSYLCRSSNWRKINKSDTYLQQSNFISSMRLCIASYSINRTNEINKNNQKNQQPTQRVNQTNCAIAKKIAQFAYQINCSHFSASRPLCVSCVFEMIQNDVHNMVLDDARNKTKFDMFPHPNGNNTSSNEGNVAYG